MTHISDDLYLGNVNNLGGALDQAAPSPNAFGFGPMGRVYIWDVVPIALSTTSIVNALAGVTAAADVAMNGALVSGALVADRVATLDCARRLTMVSSGADTHTITIYGTDVYGQSMSYAAALTTTTPVVILKAFKTVTRITCSGTMAGTLSVGHNDALGLPVYLANNGYVLSVKWNNVLTQDGGAFVVGVTTSPATAITGDVRGVYTPSSVADGAKRLVAAFALTGSQVGPNATRASLAGVNQNLVVA